jgi:hypothetical protein
VVELHADHRHDAPSVVALTANGDRASGDVQLRRADGDWQPGSLGEVQDFASLRALRIDLPGGLASEVKVWAHATSRDGTDEPLAVRVTARGARGSNALELGPGADLKLRLVDGPCQLEIVLVEAAEVPGPADFALPAASEGVG